MRRSRLLGHVRAALARAGIGGALLLFSCTGSPPEILEILWEVRLEQDISETDEYERLLRYVYVDATFVNAELVKLGLAEARGYPPDTKYQDLLEQREKEARQAGRGMWAK